MTRHDTHAQSGLRMRPLRLLMCGIVALAYTTPVLSQQVSAAAPHTLGFSVDRLARIDSVMLEHVNQGHVGGTVVYLMRHGQVAYAKAFGYADKESGRRMKTDAIFRIASQTKAITSVAVMKLVEQGKLQLGDPVSRYLPSFAHTTVAVKTDTGRSIVPARREITIRDLLTHTAGISYGTDSLVAPLYQAAGLGPAAGWGWYTADKTEPICSTIDRLGALPFVAQPGERFVYGYNTDILGCLVERVSGQSLDAFMQQHILQPLRLKDTHFFLPAGQEQRLTTVYMHDEAGKLARAPDGPKGQGDYVTGPRTSFAGGAGLLSTASDYAHFLQMLLNKGTLGGVRILAPRTVELMTVNQSGTLFSAEGGFGLGFAVTQRFGVDGRMESPGSFGWGGAYGSTYLVDPKNDMVMVFMMQLLPNRNLDIPFVTLVYQALEDLK